MNMRLQLLTLGFSLLMCGMRSQAALPVYDYEIVHTYPHDAQAFTEGLFYLHGFLYESTGLEGRSSIRKVRLETGEVLQKVEIPARYFGEGIVNWKRHLVSLTWKSQVGFVYDLATLNMEHRFSYQGEGWALTQDGRRLIMSDGTAQLRFLNPDTLQETGRIRVTREGEPVRNLNELEWVKGQIYANVWQTNVVVLINPDSGAVTGIIDFSRLLGPPKHPGEHPGELNGIAYDARRDRLFVTGKNWPTLFEVRLQTRSRLSSGMR